MKKSKIIIIATLAFISLAFISILFVTVHQKNLSNQNLIIFLEREIKKTNILFNSEIEELNKKNLEIERTKQILEEKISILESAIQGENIRWAKIKKIRKIVKTVIKEKKYPIKLNITSLTNIASSIIDYSEKYEVPVHLVLAIIEQESAFDPGIQSHMQAKGLMQLMDTTARECAGDLGIRYYNIYHINTNINFGIWYLRKVLDIFHDKIDLAIKAYNCGPTCVQRVECKDYLKYPEETNKYYKIVMQNIEKYKLLGL